jgi:hypothetical protein
VIGLDMTAKQLDIARTHIDWHMQVEVCSRSTKPICVKSSYYCLLGMQKFGYSTPNVRFVEGIIEDLGAAGIQVSFCSIVTKTWCPCLSHPLSNARYKPGSGRPLAS